MIEWKDIDLYGSTRYEVSNTGQIRNKETNKVLKNKSNTSGYQQVLLYKFPNRYNRCVHRLVAEAFIPNPNNYTMLDHIDRDVTNCNVSNLRWCSRSDNNKNKKLYSSNIWDSWCYLA